jgi:hypothetical protein
VILAMRAARRRSGKGAPRHTTPATRPPSGGGVPAYSPRKCCLAGTRGYAGKGGGTALQRAQDRPNPFVVDEALKGIWHIERVEKSISPSMKATFSLGQDQVTPATATRSSPGAVPARRPSRRRPAWHRTPSVFASSPGIAGDQEP